MQKGITYQSLKSRILSEELSPGMWLVERDISQTYSISRTPVREILRTLASEGLVSLVPSRGYTVKKLSLEEIVNIFQARETIEATAARLSCVKGDEDFLSRIRALTGKLEKLNVSQNSASGVVLGNELHDAIVAAVNNPIISEFYEKLKNLSTLVRNLTKKSAKIEINSKKDHLAIANAILRRDEVTSEETMREHLRVTCRLLVDSYLIE